jgi:hypothetical protein
VHLTDGDLNWALGGMELAKWSPLASNNGDNWLSQPIGLYAIFMLSMLFSAIVHPLKLDVKWDCKRLVYLHAIFRKGRLSAIHCFG